LKRLKILTESYILIPIYQKNELKAEKKLLKTSKSRKSDTNGNNVKYSELIDKKIN